MILKPRCTSELSGTLDRVQIAEPQRTVSDSVRLGRAREFAYICIVSQVLLILLAPGQT